MNQGLADIRVRVPSRVRDLRVARVRVRCFDFVRSAENPMSENVTELLSVSADLRSELCYERLKIDLGLFILVMTSFGNVTLHGEGFLISLSQISE